MKLFYKMIVDTYNEKTFKPYTVKIDFLGAAFNFLIANNLVNTGDVNEPLQTILHKQTRQQTFEER